MADFAIIIIIFTHTAGGKANVSETKEAKINSFKYDQAHQYSPEQW